MKIVHMKKRCKKDMVPLLKYAVSVVLSLIFLIPSTAGPGSRTRNLSYLEDFAKIYGVARWFMPADEAADVDWNALALYGAHEIPECASDEEFYRERKEIRPLFPHRSPKLPPAAAPHPKIKNCPKNA